MLSENLRVELEPLGVHVMTAMVGSVGTNIYTNYEVKLPPGSAYEPVEGIISKQASGELEKPFHEDVDITARNLVNDALRGRTGKVWRGGAAGFAKYASWLLPTRLVEYMLHYGRGLDKLS